jgi:hypothetical protein
LIHGERSQARYPDANHRDPKIWPREVHDDCVPETGFPQPLEKVVEILPKVRRCKAGNCRERYSASRVEAR